VFLTAGEWYEGCNLDGRGDPPRDRRQLAVFRREIDRLVRAWRRTGRRPPRVSRFPSRQGRPPIRKVTAARPDVVRGPWLERRTGPDPRSACAGCATYRVPRRLRAARPADTQARGPACSTSRPARRTAGQEPRPAQSVVNLARRQRRAGSPASRAPRGDPRPASAVQRIDPRRGRGSSAIGPGGGAFRACGAAPRDRSRVPELRAAPGSSAAPPGATVPAAAADDHGAWAVANVHLRDRPAEAHHAAAGRGTTCFATRPEPGLRGRRPPPAAGPRPRPDGVDLVLPVPGDARQGQDRGSPGATLTRTGPRSCSPTSRRAHPDVRGPGRPTSRSRSGATA